MAGSDVVQRVGHESATTDDLGRYRITAWSPGSTSWRSRAAASRHARAAARRARVAQRAGADGVPHHVPSARPRRTPRRGIQLAPGGMRWVSTSPWCARGDFVSPASCSTRRERLSPRPMGSSAALAPSARLHRGLPATLVGRFMVAAVEPGEYRLAVGGEVASPVGSAGRPEHAELPMTVTTDLDDVVVITQPGIIVSGRVVLADAPPASAPRLRIAFHRGDRSMVHSPDIVASIDGDCGFGPPISSVRGWCACPHCRAAGPSRPSC